MPSTSPSLYAGIDWVIAHRNTDGLNIRVLNLSVGTGSTLPYWSDPLAFAAERAWKMGIVVVAAAGNDGKDTKALGITSPAFSPLLIAVRAADTNGTVAIADDTVAEYTSSSSSTNMRFPDFVAPGAHVPSLHVCGSNAEEEIVATQAADAAAESTKYQAAAKALGWPDTLIASSFKPAAVVNPYVGERFLRGSGSSQAAAFVSGAVALIMSLPANQTKNLTPDDIKAALRKSAEHLRGGSQSQQGDGEISLVKAMIRTTTGNKQNLRFAEGGGSLDASRGGPGTYLEDENGAVLSGPQDIFGTYVDTKLLASYEQYGLTSSGWKYFWNNEPWGDTPAGFYEDVLLGHTWGSRGHWQGNSWTGAKWASDDWAGGKWAGGKWAGGKWAGGKWAGAKWAGGKWAGGKWAGGKWAGGKWVGAKWASSALG